MGTPSFVDPRRSPRTRGANPIRLTIAFEYPYKQHKALTIDASLHGVRIRIDVPLSPGERVVILPEGRSQDRITAHVVWVRAVEISAGYVAGLEFVKPLTPLAVPQ
jgi:hypothetical protein